MTAAMGKKIRELFQRHLWVLLFVLFIVFMGFGLFRGEAIGVFEKARIICLECIGIG